jgi:hypothetical protein
MGIQTGDTPFYRKKLILPYTYLYYRFYNEKLEVITYYDARQNPKNVPDYSA